MSSYIEKVEEYLVFTSLERPGTKTRKTQLVHIPGFGQLTPVKYISFTFTMNDFVKEVQNSGVGWCSFGMHFFPICTW